MDTVTHALAPVIITRMVFGQPAWVGKRGFWIIGIAGALPDLLNPHLSLEARMSSWSHGLAFWGLFTFLAIAAACFNKPRFPPKLAIAASLAYVFHMFCDGISGGVDLFRPFGSFVWGDYYVDPKFWVPLDIVLLLIFYFQLRVLPSYMKKQR